MRVDKALRCWFYAAVNLTWLTAASAVPVPFPQLPPEVQKGIQAELKGGTVGEIEREEEDGKVAYTFEINRSGKSIDYTLNEAGAVVSVEVTLFETPPAVHKTIEAQIGQSAVESIDKTFEDGKVTYEVDWKSKDGAEHSFTVLEDGKLDSVQFILGETPPAIQAAITKEAAGAPVKEISKTFEDNVATYDVTVNRGGADRDFRVAENGTLESRQVLLTEVPPAAQKTIQQTIGNGKIVQIDQSFEKKMGVFPFEVEGVKDGKPFNFSVGPKGRFLGMDE